MTKTFRQGDRVSWNTSQGTTYGKVVEKLTSDTKIEDHQVRASEDDPQYLVESEKTGARAAHTSGALKKTCAALRRARGGRARPSRRAGRPAPDRARRT